MLARLICRLFHKTWRTRVCLDDPEECQRKGVYNRVVERRCCMACGNIFTWSIR